MPLDQRDINIGANLQDKISTYHYRALGVKSADEKLTHTLTRLKMMDTVKDGAPLDLAKHIFGINDSLTAQECTELPSKIKVHFDSQLHDGLLILLSYTRIKSRGNQDVIMEGFNCDCIIPDCGPLYGPGNEKTPVIKRVDGHNYPSVKYSLGNIMDTGPSSSGRISPEFEGIYNITPDIMKLLGYPNCQISVNKDKVNKDNLLIFIDNFKDAVARSLKEFKSDAQGNRIKKELLNDSNTKLPRKKNCYISNR